MMVPDTDDRCPECGELWEDCDCQPISDVARHYDRQFRDWDRQFDKALNNIKEEKLNDH